MAARKANHYADLPALWPAYSLPAIARMKGLSVVAILRAGQRRGLPRRYGPRATMKRKPRPAADRKETP